MEIVLVRAPSALSPTSCKGDVNGSEGHRAAQGEVHLFNYQVYGEEVTYMEAPALHRMLSYNRQGRRNGAKLRFVAPRTSSLYIEKIPCVIHMLSV